MKTIRIGCGAGYSGDRLEPAVELALHGRLDYLVFECLAERTIAIAQQAKARDPKAGFDPLLVERLTAVLPACAERGITVITNMGAANPEAAGTVVRELARSLGLRGLRVAVVTGDDVLDLVRREEQIVAETGEPVAALGEALLSANAYLGAEGIRAALAQQADVVLTGRVADPSLFVAPLLHAFGWDDGDWKRVGEATVVGHLLECAGQVTGGYFADPGVKDVDGLARLGLSARRGVERRDCGRDEGAGLGRAGHRGDLPGAAALRDENPAAYVTPDVVADFSHVRLTAVGADAVEVKGAGGRPRPETLKVSLGYRDGFLGEGQISYAGPGAVGRARLALAIVVERLRLTGVPIEELRGDLIGVDAVHGARLSAGAGEPYEVRVRVAGRTRTWRDAARIGREVEALYTNGPAGGGGATRSVRELLAMASTFVPRDLVRADVRCEEA